MTGNGKADVLASRARRAAATTGASVRRTGRGLRAKAYGKLVELHERLHEEAERGEIGGIGEIGGSGPAGGESSR